MAENFDKNAAQNFDPLCQICHLLLHVVIRNQTLIRFLVEVSNLDPYCHRSFKDVRQIRP